MDDDNETLSPRFPIEPEALIASFGPTWERLINGKRILDPNHLLKTPDSLLEWAEFMENIDNRRVASTHLNGFWVSTVFLGLDHGYGGSPLFFETMVFDDEKQNPRADVGAQIHNLLTGAQWLYETWDQAEKGHATMVEMIRLGLF